MRTHTHILRKDAGNFGGDELAEHLNEHTEDIYIAV
jgi:hypothetical protein